MRHSYTPIFSDVLTSRVWALPHAHLRVWLWLQLMADPEGYVCADVAGVAIGARVDGKDAREALEVLALPDADADPDDPTEGRLIERVPRGWRIVDFEEKRELAKAEGRKARARRYMRSYRARPANEVDEPHTAALPEDTGSPGVPSVTPPRPKPKPKTKPLPSEGKNPPTPTLLVVDPEEDPTAGVRVVVPGGSRVLFAIPGDWKPSDALRADAAMAGIARFEERLASLRGGPIGGTRGVFEHALEDYIRAFFGRWRTWEETDRSKSGPRTVVIEAPKPDRAVKGMPPWVRKEHAEFASKAGLPLKALAKRFALEHHIPPEVLEPQDAATAFRAFLEASVNKEVA